MGRERNSQDVVEVPVRSTEDLIERYDALLLDAYGVLVDSDGAVAGAAAFVRRLERLGKPYLVITNDASRLPETSAAWYRRNGLEIGAERIVTSGSLLKPHFRSNGLAGARCLVLGPEDSRRYVVGAGGVVVEADGSPAFDVLVLGDESGFPMLETLDAVVTGLVRRLDAGDAVHLVLPNPDLLYPKSGSAYGIAIGSLAAQLEAILAQRYPGRSDLRFRRLGKPFPAIFEEAVRRVDTRNALVIGDQLSTDVRGAADFGLDSALVEGGLHRRRTTWRRDELRPTYVLRSLS